jgi:hypothetical protein
VREGCGLKKTAAPLVKTGGATLWFYFGGEIYESVLRELYPSQFDKPVLAGIAIRVHQDFNLAAIQGSSHVGIERFLQGQGLRLLGDEGIGRFAEELPKAGVEAMLGDLRVADHFMTWIRSRKTSTALPMAKWPTLAALLAEV